MGCSKKNTVINKTSWCQSTSISPTKSLCSSHLPTPTIFVLYQYHDIMSHLYLMHLWSPPLFLSSLRPSQPLNDTVMFLPCEIWSWTTTVISQPVASHCLSKDQAPRLLSTLLHLPQTPFVARHDLPTSSLQDWVSILCSPRSFAPHQACLCSYSAFLNTAPWVHSSIKCITLTCIPQAQFNTWLFPRK